MANVQQADVIEFVAPSQLKPDPLNLAIYGEDGYQDLIESIKELGVLQALYVTSQGLIVSGHRRWRAAISAQCPTIPIIRMNYTTDLDRRRAIIEHNRYRIKNGQQLYNEGKELEAIEAKRHELLRREKIADYQKTGQTVETLPPSKTRDVVARTIGLGSGKQWDKLEYVAENKPALLREIKPDGITLHRAYIEARQEIAKGQEVSIPLPTGIFNVVYADPPWQFHNAGFEQSSQSHYRTMPTSEICDLNIPTADDAVLFLWATNAMLMDALEVMKAWGFEYKSNFVWVKNTGPGIGWYVLGRHELLLIGIKGNMGHPKEKFASVITADVIRHSGKPDKVYELIEAMYQGAYIELFARQTRSGWESWGNEV